MFFLLLDIDNLLSLKHGDLLILFLDSISVFLAFLHDLLALIFDFLLSLLMRLESPLILALLEPREELLPRDRIEFDLALILAHYIILLMWDVRWGFGVLGFWGFGV